VNGAFLGNRKSELPKDAADVDVNSLHDRPNWRPVNYWEVAAVRKKLTSIGRE
jgi:hypothetical protein